MPNNINSVLFVKLYCIVNKLFQNKFFGIKDEKINKPYSSTIKKTIFLDFLLLFIAVFAISAIIITFVISLAQLPIICFSY